MPNTMRDDIAFWTLKKEAVLEALNTDLTGLDEQEAKKRRKKYGANELQRKRRLSRLSIFLRQFKSPLILILMLAGVVTMILHEWINALVILATVLVNAALGYWQENKAETVLEELRSYIRTRVRVRRNGREREMDAAELVPGDIIHISQGDRVPADGRILTENGLHVDESILTGESLPVEKSADPIKRDTPLAERVNMVWSGTLADQGYAEVLVTSTGGRTEFGRIASLVGKREEEDTPLQLAVKKFARLIGIAVILLSAILFGIGFTLGQDPFEMFFISVAIAVSAVPEGLPVALTVILAIGVERLAKQKGIVRKLLAAETLGSTSLILTDKTGTLTEADMKLVEVSPFEKNADGKRELLKEAVLTTDLVIENPDEPPDAWRIIGRSMESSLVRDAGKDGIALPKLLERTAIEDRLPFNSKQKFSAIIYQEEKDRRLAILGAPEIVLGLTEMSEQEKKKILNDIDARAHGGERILGLASKPVSEKTNLAGELDEDALEFKGTLSFRDPLRQGVDEAIRRIGKAGVKTVIVTGDHKGTAEHVARELGILNGRGLVLTGEELARMDEASLRKLLPDVRVYARTTPEQKLMLTRIYRLEGEVVSVTGDGVNDAPALQAADVGVAVGSGTEVAKGASDLVILDDNFNTIVVAIEEGRRILDNIRKAIVYLLSNSLNELFLIGGAILFSIPIPLNALQILFVNFFSDSFPAVALAFEEIRDSTTRSRNRGAAVILNSEVRFLISALGIATSVFLFILYRWLLSQNHDPEIVRTFIFAAFASYTLFLAFALRGLRHSIFRYNPFGNMYLNAGVAIGLLLTISAVYLPFLQNILGTVSLPWPWLVGVICVGLVNILFVELSKWLYRNSED